MGRRFLFGGGPGPRMFERGYLKYALLELLLERPKHGYEMMKNLEERMGGFYAPSAGAVYPTLQMLEDRGWATSETLEGKKVYTITDAGRAALAEAVERRGGRPDAGAPGFGPRGFGPGFGPDFGPDFGPRGPHHEHGRGPHDGPPHGSGPRDWRERGSSFGRGGERRNLAEMRHLAREARELGRLFLITGRESIGNPERIAKLRAIVERTRAELEAFANAPREGGWNAGDPDAPTPNAGPATETGGPVEQL